MVAVSIFHMRGGRVVDKRELFWEDQDSFEPGEFFQSVLKQYYVDAPFIPVEIHVPVDLPAVLADYELIMSVLTNLLSNAFRYAPEGDIVRLEAELIYDPDDDRSTVVELRVIDRGPGITEERQAELFTRFSTFANLRRPAIDRPGQPLGVKRTGTTRWSATTGLGLYISRGIIEAHGSTLRLQSSPGQGAIFAFTLPIASPGKIEVR